MDSRRYRAKCFCDYAMIGGEKVKTDLVGKRFGSLVVQNKFQRVRQQHGTKIKWLCRCDCGNEMYLFRESILHHTDNYCQACKPIARRNTKLYHIYHGMLQRCYNPNNPSYPKYGGAGIYVCDEWRKSYDAFLEWAVQTGYHEPLTIDRRESGGPYAPWNCQWLSLSDNSAKANLGRQKNHSKLCDMYAKHKDGTLVQITNIAEFCRTHDLKYTTVMAYLHGRCSTDHRYHGWQFYSNLTETKV